MSRQHDTPFTTQSRLSGRPFLFLDIPGNRSTVAFFYRELGISQQHLGPCGLWLATKPVAEDFHPIAFQSGDEGCLLLLFEFERAIEKTFPVKAISHVDHTLVLHLFEINWLCALYPRWSVFFEGVLVFRVL